MAKLPKAIRDARQVGSLAEEFKPSQEDKFSPTLERMYWANPNTQKGEVALCSYYTEGGWPKIKEVKSKTGI